ncbi:MAG TPA: 3-oxoacyl-[acyl-carrier-protein] synthase III C-terminal domain-containing protein, partial [Myxococcales bacterium]|nr:3-oxoacyl-[acyl-carrier-protein] synthase III C-terminal domain-containing protein [Myxococcales bacterium]
MGRWKDDPFHGIVERRVAPAGMRSSDMELEAAQAALSNAGIEAGDVDLLLLQSVVPDRALSTNPAMLHRRLGLPTRCAGVETDRTCGGFMFQLQMAAAYLHASGARYALLVQSSLLSRILDYSNPVSTTFGDAATAVVLGRVGSEEGILSIRSYMDGHYDGMAVLAPPDDGPWYSGCGPLSLCTKDRDRLREVPLVSAATARDSIAAGLDEANLRRQDVSFMACHQPTSSFNAICRRASGLGDVPTIDTFRTLGAMGSCVVPINLDLGRRQGLVRAGQNVVLF